MTTKKFEKTDKKGRTEEWIWEETPEVKAALKKYWATVKSNSVSLL